MEAVVSRLAESPRPETRRLRLISQRGVSAIEYSLLAALIAIVVVGAVSVLGDNLGDVFDSLADKIHT